MKRNNYVCIFKLLKVIVPSFVIQFCLEATIVIAKMHNLWSSC